MSFDTKIKLSLTCRLCANLITNSVLLPLYFSIDHNDEAPIIIIERYINDTLQIRKDDNLPQQICHDCLKKFRIINDFITRAVKAQERLKDFFNSKKVLSVKTEDVNIKTEDFFDYDQIEESEPLSNEAKENSNKHSDFEFSDCEESEIYFNDNFSEDFRFVCHLCHIELKTSFKLDKHLTIDHNLKDNDFILCEHCGENLSKSIYFRHIKQINREVSYRCKYCDEEVTSKRSLYQHYNSKHINRRNDKGSYPYSCPICKRKFKTLVYMQKHQIVSHNSKREQNPRYKPNSCKYCGQIYGRSDHLQNHIKQVHLRQMDHKCSFCGKCYSQGYQLNHHIKISHSEKPMYKCGYCWKTYLDGKRYKDHISEHSKEPKFKCVLCGLLFQKSLDLKRHEYSHNESEGLKSKNESDNENLHSPTSISNLSKILEMENTSKMATVSTSDIESFEVDYLQDDETTAD